MFSGCWRSKVREGYEFVHVSRYGCEAFDNAGPASYPSSITLSQCLMAIVLSELKLRFDREVSFAAPKLPPSTPEELEDYNYDHLFLRVPS